MDNAELKRFVDYYRNNYTGYYLDVIDHLYEKFGREFIFDLPIDYRIYDPERKYPVIQGTTYWHSTSEPLYYHHGRPKFWIFDCQLSLDEWLPRSSLSSEEQLVFKLKYG